MTTQVRARATREAKLEALQLQLRSAFLALTALQLYHHDLVRARDPGGVDRPLPPVPARG